MHILLYASFMTKLNYCYRKKSIKEIRCWKKKNAVRIRT